MYCENIIAKPISQINMFTVCYILYSILIINSNRNKYSNEQSKRHNIRINNGGTYEGISGAGRAEPVGRPCGNGGGALPTGRLRKSKVIL